MDQEIPQSELPQRPNRLRFRVGKSHLPGSDGYKGSVADQRTLSIDDIAARVVRKRTEYRQATLVSTFNLLKEEIYLALGEGLNVDFGFGRTELTLRGAFEQPYEAFDPERHAFAPRLRPSPQLRQRVAHLKGENDTHRLERDSMPLPSYVSLGYKPREAGSTEPYNEIPASEAHLLFVHGQRLKLAGDDPSVGITLRRLATGEEWHFNDKWTVLVNEAACLCLRPGIDLAPGDWKVEVVTRYRPNSTTLYKEPRKGSLVFRVV